MKKKLNVGLMGYGLMGRTHSNAYRKVSNFFDVPYEPVLKMVCGLDEAEARAFANQWAQVVPPPTEMPPSIVEVDGKDYDQPLITNPVTGEVMAPRPLFGEAKQPAEGEDPRESLADWMTSKSGST